MNKKINTSSVISHTVFILMSISFLLPLFFVVMISISNEADITKFGYSLLPNHIDFSAYKAIFTDLGQLINSFFVTVFSATVGPALTVALCASIGYSLSVKTFKYKKPIMWYIIVTMLFNGGLIPTYIINTQLLGLRNNLLVHIALGLVNAWTIILFKTFFSQIPESLIESAVIDGATQMKVLQSIVIPMSKPIVATIFFMAVLGRWNNWETSLYYITNKNLYSLQYVMQMVLREAEFIRQSYLESGLSVELLPVETLKYALTVVICVPIFLVFPYMQKSFSKGLVVGSVKG